MASSNGSPGSSLATAEEHTLTKKDPAPSVHGLSARADGTCAVTRHEGVTLFERTGDAVTQRYVETRLRHQEVALHPTASRFAVWTKTSAVILKKREVVLFVEDGAASVAPVVVDGGSSTSRRRSGSPSWGPRRRDGAREGRRRRAPSSRRTAGAATRSASAARARRRARLVADHWAVVTSTRAAFLDVDGASARSARCRSPGSPGDRERGAGRRAPGRGPAAGERPRVGRAHGGGRGGDLRAPRRRARALVATLRPETTRRYLGFGAMPSLAGGKVALGSLGWERVPASHDAAVPRVSSTSLHDTTGAVLGTTPARRVSVESVARVYTLTQVAGDRLFELSDGGDVLRVVRC